MHNDTLSRLIGKIYDAATDINQWPSVLAELCDAVDAPVGALIYHDVPHNAGSITALTGADPEGGALYNSYYHKLDPWVGRSEAAGLLHPGSLIVGEQLISHQQLKRTEYYNDFAVRYDGVRILAGTIVRTGSALANLSLVRGEKRNPFSATDVKIIGTLMPHLQRAMGIHARLNDALTHSAGLGAVLDRLQTGVVVLTEAGHVLFANRMARSMAAERDGFQLDADGPRASDFRETKDLRRLLSAAAKADQRGGGIVRLSRPSLRKPLVAFVSPLTNPASLGLGERPLIMLFVADPEIGPDLDTKTLRAIYGLAPAEAEIARSLARGASLPEIASRHKLTLNSTRWYVKQILHKTGSKSQVDLLKQLLSGPAAVLPPSSEAP